MSRLRGGGIHAESRPVRAAALLDDQPRGGFARHLHRSRQHALPAGARGDLSALRGEPLHALLGIAYRTDEGSAVVRNFIEAARRDRGASNTDELARRRARRECDPSHRNRRRLEQLPAAVPKTRESGSLARVSPGGSRHGDRFLDLATRGQSGCGGDMPIPGRRGPERPTAARGPARSAGSAAVALTVHGRGAAARDAARSTAPRARAGAA